MSASSRLRALVSLNAVPLFSPDAVRRLLAALPAERALEPSAEELAPLLGVRLETARRFREAALGFDADAELEQAARMGARLLTWDDPGFPDPLRLVADAPVLLYALGEPTLPGLAAAVVGARAPTPYGRRMARRLAGDLAAAGLTVVSGLARGIDGTAHEAALERRGRTWAVLGSGLACVYPPEHQPLARRLIEAGGCLLSELPLSARPQALNFPRRNRIVAGLSWATVVVEGRERSGSRGTAHTAAVLGREVFAVLGPADSPLSEAPLALLKAGAHPACGAGDILAALPEGARLAAAATGPAPLFSPVSLSSEYRKIIDSLGAEALTVDELYEGTGIDLPRLSNILFEMELQGLLNPVPGQRYAKKD